MSTKLSSSKLVAYALIWFLSTIILSTLIYIIEHGYGNADGVWFDKNIIITTYKILLAESLIVITIVGLFFSNKKIQYLFFVTLFTLFLIFIVEKMSLMIVNFQTKQTAGVAKNQVQRQDHELSVEPDSILGVRAKRNTVIHWLPQNKYQKFDSVQITIDSLSRRETPSIEGAKINKYALFLGCSYTFGDGVSDDQTMPYYFQQNSPNYRAYNLGYLAYSPLHALALLQHKSTENNIFEKDGVGIFTYINDHIDRVIPATRWLELTKGKFPYLNETNMQTEGLYADRRRIYSEIVLASQSSGIKQLFRLGYPKYHTESHYKLVVDILKKTEKEYIKRFKNDNFYVIIFPGNPITDRMRQLFKESNIKYFDYSGLTSVEDKMLKFDNAHPTPELYEIVAKKLHQDLQARDIPTASHSVLAKK